ncbi:MAG TPA: DUF1573 domain-containing protein [Isosphaeraceae bacterium]|jgi:hypothetical protein|nr:DUF1573 domain-containing protein [Isosphaeraceae bacterium]
MRLALLTLAAAAIFGAAAAPAPAQEWVPAVFPDRNVDLGTVARGSKISHTFRVVNTTNQEIRILETKAKCGCTDVRVGARVIPPGTQTRIDVVLDTTRFVNYKASGVTLTIDRPTYTVVDLNVNAFIRGDVTLNPGVADFGVVARSNLKPISLVLSYAGGAQNWRITKAETVSEHVVAEWREISRSPGAAQYQITARLEPGVPSGYLRDQITLRTNDPSAPSIPISVAANVQAAVSVAPAIINLGQVKAGQSVRRNILVRAAQPFKVTALKAARDSLSAPPPADARGFHTLAVTFKAPAKPGPFNDTLDIETDLKGEPPGKLTIFAQVVP